MTETIRNDNDDINNVNVCDDIIIDINEEDVMMIDDHYWWNGWRVIIPLCDDWWY